MAVNSNNKVDLAEEKRLGQRGFKEHA